MEVVPDDHMLLFFCIDYTIWPGAVEHGVWKSQKSLIQHCERSELRLHFEWTKVPKNAKKLKLVENAKCDIFGDFQTLCSFSYFFTDNFFFLNWRSFQNYWVTFSGWNHRGVYILSRKKVLETKIRRKLSPAAHRRMRMDYHRWVQK